MASSMNADNSNTVGDCKYLNGHNSTSPQPIKTTVVSPQTRSRRSSRNTMKLFLLLLNCLFMAVGTIGGPLLLRLYYIHGGARKWLSSFLQNAGFPILFIPLSILYIRSKDRGAAFFIEPKLFFFSAVIGVLLGLDNFTYAFGLAFIPISTSSLLFATQLVFTAGFAFLIVKHKFTPYSINSVILMTLGSVMLGLRTNGDRPAGVSNEKYFMGFFFTLGSAALSGFILPTIEYAYSKARQTINYTRVLQFQLCVAVFASIFSGIGMLVNNDFKAIPREAREYELGHGMYYFVLFAIAIVFQFSFLGSLGVIFCSTSLLSGILSAVLLPFTEVAAVIVYHEKFTGEKGMALAMCLWGFTSYFYGEYKMKKTNIDPIPPPQTQVEMGAA